jgi:hypothetical protein
MARPICAKGGRPMNFSALGNASPPSFICLNCDPPNVVEPRIRGWLSSADLKPPK